MQFIFLCSIFFFYFNYKWKQQLIFPICSLRFRITSKKVRIFIKNFFCFNFFMFAYLQGADLINPLFLEIKKIWTHYWWKSKETLKIVFSNIQNFVSSKYFLNWHKILPIHHKDNYLSDFNPPNLQTSPRERQSNQSLLLLLKSHWGLNHTHQISFVNKARNAYQAPL